MFYILDSVESLNVWSFFMVLNMKKSQKYISVRLLVKPTKHDTLTVFPFSSQVMVGVGFPVALHSRETWLPYSTRFSLGTRRIRAGAEHTHRRRIHCSKSITAHVSFPTVPEKRK